MLQADFGDTEKLRVEECWRRHLRDIGQESGRGCRRSNLPSPLDSISTPEFHTASSI